MSIFELFVLAFALAMDAFAVSITKGLSLSKMNWKKALITGLYFGVFQAIMPLIGFLLGSQFDHLIKDIDHWIAFILLTLIGLNMIKEAFGEEENCNPDFSFKAMIPLAIATSIDALAIGVTFAFLNVNILYAITIIGVTTFLISMLGVKIGHVFGVRYKSKAEIAGGVILIFIGLKILLEHLEIFIL